MKTILVTPRSVTRHGHPSLQRLEERGFKVIFCSPGVLPSEEELLQLLPGCIGYLAGVERVSAKVLKAATELKVISRNGTGIDSVERGAAEQLGIRILVAQGANARGVAELTMAHILCLARSLATCDRSLKSGKWERGPGFELEGKTLGLVGCGRIGRLVTGFALAFGMRVLAYDPMPLWDNPPKGFRFEDLSEVCRQSDVMSLHCPPAENGRPVLTRELIAKFKHGILVINTARGGLIDSDAMLDALASGRVAGLGLDAFEGEPPDDRRLLDYPKVLATPHIGGFTPQSIDRAMTIAVDNLIEALTP